jgi:hypothetical protein
MSLIIGQKRDSFVGSTGEDTVGGIPARRRGGPLDETYCIDYVNVDREIIRIGEVHSSHQVARVK